MVRTLLRVALLIRWLSGGPMSARTPAMDLALACTHGRWIGEAQFAACVPCIAAALTCAEALAGAAQQIGECLDVDPADERVVRLLDDETRTRALAPNVAQVIAKLHVALAVWRARDEAKP